MACRLHRLGAQCECRLWDWWWQNHSLDGLHVRFETMDVSGMRLGALRGRRSCFDGWGEAMLHFGRSVASGSVSVSVIECA